MSSKIMEDLEETLSKMKVDIKTSMSAFKKLCLELQEKDKKDKELMKNFKKNITDNKTSVSELKTMILDSHEKVREMGVILKPIKSK